MSRAKFHLMKLCLLLPLVALSACSKTVQWEEEVPLNTGEVIWVKRTVKYTYQGGAGNPLDLAYRPDWPEVLEFTWRANNYRYEGDARVILLAISPEKHPVLVARAADGSWNWKHNYFCVTPFYVQFAPDATGKNWTWPPAIEPWLFGLSHNLLRTREAPEKMQARYTAKQRNEEDAPGSFQDSSKARIEPNHTVNSCIRRN